MAALPNTCTGGIAEVDAPGNDGLNLALGKPNERLGRCGGAHSYAPCPCRVALALPVIAATPHKGFGMVANLSMTPFGRMLPVTKKRLCLLKFFRLDGEVFLGAPNSKQN